MTPQDRIKADAEAYANQFKHGLDYRKPAYIDGATAEATHTETLANVLDQIAQAPTPDNEREMISWIQTARHLCQTALEQWKTGKEKEPDDKCRCIQPNWNAFTGKCLTCGKP